MKTVRIDHVTVVSADAPRAAATFENIFGLAKAPGAPAGGVALTIGDARIEFITPAGDTPLAEALRSGGEGMAALTLMVADLDETARALERAAVAFETRTDGKRRALEVDPRAAHGVRLTLVARV